MKEKRKVSGWKKSFKKDWQIWVMLLPALIWVIVFCYTPMYGIQLAFRQYDFRKGLTGGNWEGLRYFKQYFTSPMFGTTIKNTFVIAFTSIIVGFSMPILLAIVINQLKRGKIRKVMQTVVYMPYFISTVVLVSMLTILCSPAHGVITDVLRALHIIGESTNLLGDSKTFVPVYVLSGVWQSCGWNSIIYIAALSGVDAQLYDAARVDGANRWQLI